MTTTEESDTLTWRSPRSGMSACETHIWNVKLAARASRTSISNVTIHNADIQGLTIAGFDILALIAAELKRKENTWTHR